MRVTERENDTMNGNRRGIRFFLNTRGYSNGIGPVLAHLHPTQHSPIDDGCNSVAFGGQCLVSFACVSDNIIGNFGYVLWRWFAVVTVV